MRIILTESQYSGSNTRDPHLVQNSDTPLALRKLANRTLPSYRCSRLRTNVIPVIVRTNALRDTYCFAMSLSTEGELPLIQPEALNEC